MKKNYNPYSVPDGFFENTRSLVMTKYRRSRRIFLCSAAAAVAAALILTSPSFIDNSKEQNPVIEEVYGNSLADLYEFDIFLQVNF